METTTSERIIKFLENTEHHLTSLEKQTIRRIIYDSLTDAYEEGGNKNGCDCGQPSCSVCHG